MAGAVAGALTEDEIARLIAMPKTLSSDVVYSATPKGGALWTFSEDLLDAEGKTIAGLTVFCEFKMPVIYDHCKFRFTMHLFRPSLGKRRVYQLEMVTRTHKSHVGPEGRFYGPHQHHGERASLIPSTEHLGCKDQRAWFDVFLSVAGIGFDMRYFAPSATTLFDQP